MLHTFTKKGLRGFTLIELLVVIAIIGLLSTVIAAPITESRKKGRDAKKVADLRSISTALALYAEDNGGVYPNSLDGLVPRYIPNLPSNAATTTVARDKYMYATYVENSRNVAYHLGVKLESGNQGLNDDADCHTTGNTVTAGNTKTCAGTSADTNAALPICTTACTVANSNYAASGAGNPAATSNTTDFGGGTDTSTTGCTASLTSCIYDLVN